MDRNERHVSYYFMAEVLDYRMKMVKKAHKWNDPRLMKAAIEGDYYRMWELLVNRISAFTSVVEMAAADIGYADYTNDPTAFTVVAAQTKRVVRKHRKLLKLRKLLELAKRMHFEQQGRDIHPMNMPLPQLMAEVARLEEEVRQRIHA